MSPITVVYSARKIITMNPSRPTATHVAVREGRVSPDGDELCGAWRRQLDEPVRRQGADARLRRRPQPHHGRRSGVLPYVGSLDRRRRRARPRGRRHRRDRRAIAALRPHWTIPRRRCSPGDSIRCISAANADRQDLDRVSTTRPVGDPCQPPYQERQFDRAGAPSCCAPPTFPAWWPAPTGWPAANCRASRRGCRAPCARAQSAIRQSHQPGCRALRVRLRAGRHDLTDLHNDLTDETLDVYRRSLQADFGVRLVPALASVCHTPQQAIAKLAGAARGRQRQAALRHRQDRGRRLDPGLYRTAALARLSQRRRQWPVVRRPRTAAAGRGLSPRRRAAAHPHQWRRGHRTGARRHRGRADRDAAAGSSPHAAALPDGRRGAVPPHEAARRLRRTCSPIICTTGATRTTNSPSDRSAPHGSTPPAPRNASACPMRSIPTRR